MTARNDLATALASELRPRAPMSERAVERLADALLPVVERIANQRAATELRAAADWFGRGAAGRPGPLRLAARKLNDRADRLDPS